MKRKTFLSILLTFVLIFSMSIMGCYTEDGFMGDKSNYSQNPSMSGGIATSLESVNRTPIGAETLDREDDSDSLLTKNRKSVVEIYTITSTGSAGGASGVIIGYTPFENADLDGNIGVAYVLTCHHVIESAVYANVRDFYGTIYPAGLIGSHPGGDTALVWIKVKQEPSVAKIASSASLQVGETVYAIGNPTSMLGGTVTKGIISSLSRELLLNNQYIDLLQIDAAINGGSSGGGLFTEDGYLVGMTNSGYEGRDGLGFAVPSDSFISDVNNFISTYHNQEYNTYGYIPGEASVGVSISYQTDFWGNYIDNGVIGGLTDTGSWKNSGVLIGDKIVSVTINQQTYVYDGASKFLQYLAEQDLTVGDTYVLTVIRSNQQIDLTITVKQLIYYPPTIQQNTPQSSVSSQEQTSTSQEDSAVSEEIINSQQNSVVESISSNEVIDEQETSPFANKVDLSQVLSSGMYFGEGLTNYRANKITLYQLVREDDSNSKLTQNRKSVVEIYTKTSSSSGGAGSGVIIGFSAFEQADENGGLGVAYIITNHHVINGAFYVNVKDMFSEKLYPSGLIGSDEYADIAVIYTILDYVPSVAKFCNSDNVYVGDTIYAIGNPLGTLGGSVSKGVISALQRVSIMDGFAMELLQVDSALNNGSSGGGIFNEEGYLVAIANSGFPNYDGLGFAIPSNNALFAVNSILETYKDNVYNSYGYVKGSVNLGVSINNYGNNIWQEGENANNQVVYVSSIKENGCFYKSGIEEGDFIYSISYKGNNVEITGASELLVSLYRLNLQVGEIMEVVVYRNGEMLTINVLLQQYIYRPPVFTE